MSSSAGIEIIEVTDATTFALLPPCADPRFDHRTCDYWEDEVRGSKAARDAWLTTAPRPAKPKPRPRSDNPFAPPPREAEGFNPFAADDSDTTEFNPFAPMPSTETGAVEATGPRKLRLLDRGQAVFGSYAKVLLLDGEPSAYVQFGPLSAYPRAQQIRDLYPALPSSPLPAVITCVAATEAARGQGLGQALVTAIVEDLAGRGFAAIESYPDVSLERDEASAATPTFWESCGFTMAAPDERFPVMRLELG